MKHVILVFLLIYLTACNSIVTDSVRFVGFAHEVFVLKKKAILYESECTGWSGKYMLAAVGQVSPCLGKEIDQFPVGTEFTVKEIEDRFAGSHGRCWLVKIRINSKNYPFVDVPACTLWHPESWMNSSSPYAPVVLGFKPDFAEAKEH